MWSENFWAPGMWTANFWTDGGSPPDPEPEGDDEATFLPVLRRRRRHARLFSLILLLLVA